MPLIEEDAGMSVLAGTRFFLVKFFLLLTSREFNDRVRDQSATRTGAVEYQTVPWTMYTSNVLNPSVATVARHVLFYS